MFGIIMGKSRGRHTNTNCQPPAEATDPTFCVLCVIFVGGLIELLLLINFAHLQPIHTVGTVVHKYYIQEHTNQTSTGFVYDVPENFILDLQYDGEISKMAVEKKFYDNARIGEKVKITYTKSRVFQTKNMLSVDR